MGDGTHYCIVRGCYCDHCGGDGMRTTGSKAEDCDWCGGDGHDHEWHPLCPECRREVTEADLSLLRCHACGARFQNPSPEPGPLYADPAYGS